MTSGVFVLGINHHLAPVALREKLNFSPLDTPQALRQLKENLQIKEALILSTCNRTEIYGYGKPTGDLTQWWSSFCQVNEQVSLFPFYEHQQFDAICHTMRVASGLDSMILGEPQILGQFKDAYVLAKNAGSLGKYLEKLFQTTFNVAKKVRAETYIGKAPVSVAFAAVKIAEHIFEKVANQTVMLVGASQTTKLAARHLISRGVKRFILVNRSASSQALEMAQELNAIFVPLKQLHEHLHLADILITATLSKEPLITENMFKEAMRLRKHKPVLALDLAVPRDIHSDVKNIADVYLYTVDDLSQIIQENMELRKTAKVEAERIIMEEAHKWFDWLKIQYALPTIETYQKWVLQKKKVLLQEAFFAIENGKSPQAVLEQFATQFSQQLMHAPLQSLKLVGQTGNAQLLTLIQDKFLKEI